jgi:hypothetical protein
VNVHDGVVGALVPKKNYLGDNYYRARAINVIQILQRASTVPVLTASF